jgi:hypothetical protein
VKPKLPNRINTEFIGVATSCVAGKYKSEKMFFKFLLNQLKNVTAFFLKQQKELSQRGDALLKRAKDLTEIDSENIIAQQKESSTVLSLVVGFHKGELVRKSGLLLHCDQEYCLQIC